MGRKKAVKMIWVISLILALMYTQVIYASTGDQPLQTTEGISDETEEPDKVVEPKKTEELNKTVELKETEDPGESGESGETGDPVEPEKPAEPEKPPVPGETGTPGWAQQGSDWYYYDASGTKAYGWRAIGGVWYYFDKADTEKPGIMLADTKSNIDGQTYLFSASGAMLSGWILKPEGWYYTASSGAMATGWQWIGGAWYYLDGANATYPGLMLADCKKVLGHATYFFNGSGAMRTGWVLEPEGWYYGDSGSSVGWKYIGGVWYYLDETNTQYPGLMLADTQKMIGGSNYFFGPSGAMLSGWILRPEGWYYAGGSGNQLLGWIQIGGYWYYLDGADTTYPGLMLQNCEKEIGGQTYGFLPNGAMRAGWVQDKAGHWYYYHPDSGQIMSGWQWIGGAWYYLDPLQNNQMLDNGWHQFGETWYYFYGNGAMAANWLNLGGEWYYLGADGAMRIGWQLIGSTWYYFYTLNDPHGGIHGMMARNTSIDGYQLQANGAMLSSEQSAMALHAQGYSSSTGYLILVDRAACRVGIFTGGMGNWSMNSYWSCAPGKPSTPTVGGVFKVQSKGHYFDSGSSRCYWYTQFHGNYLFHSVLYNKYTGGLSDGRVGMQLSHGCVRLEIGNAKWIYDNIPGGTTVVIY